MDISNLDELSEKIKKRTGEIENFLRIFLENWNSNENHVKIKCIEDASEMIATIYFHIIYNNVKGEYFKHDGHINRYKVASGTEIACMLVKPLKFDQPGYNNSENNIAKINARLATELAIQILYSIHFEDHNDYPNPTKDKAILAALGSHTYWVRYFDETKYLPVYLNSTFWEMYMAAITLEPKLL